MLFFLLTDDSVQERWSQYWCLETILWGKSKRDSGFCCFFCRSQRGIKDCIILKSSRILLFLLQESKRDRRLHYSEKFLDFVVLLQESKIDKRLHYSEKFQDFVLSSAESKRDKKTTLFWKSYWILLFFLQESKSDQKTALFWKVPGFCCFFCRSPRGIYKNYIIWKVPGFCYFFCRSPRGIEHCIILKSTWILLFLLQSAGVKDG